MRAVLDASALLEGFDPQPPGEFAVPPSVVDEVSKGRAGERARALLAAGLQVREPSEGSRRRVDREARAMGEGTRLSRADVDVLALSMDLGVPCVTDDYSVQNLAACLGVEALPFLQEGIREVWRWGLRCRGCGRWAEGGEGDVCPVCGSELRTARRR